MGNSLRFLVNVSQKANTMLQNVKFAGRRKTQKRINKRATFFDAAPIC